MRYTLSAEEQAKVAPQQAQLSAGNCSMNRVSLRKSGSHWNEEHLHALRVVHLDDLPLERFFATEHIPNAENHALFAEWRQEILAISEEELRGFTSYVGDDYLHNLFGDLFSKFAIAVSTHTADITTEEEGGRQESAQSGGSGSSNEDKPEEASRVCLSGLFQTILRSAQMSVFSDNLSFVCQDNALQTKIYLGTFAVLNANTDGGIILRKQNAHGSNVLGNYPIVSFEAKRRHAGGVKHHTGEPERVSRPVLAQEFAELLGQAIMQCKQAGGGWKNQESWCVTIHGTEVRLVTAFFSKRYLGYVKSPFMRPSERLVVFRSQPFNMKLGEGREMALKAAIALLQHIKSGNAHIKTDSLDS